MGMFNYKKRGTYLNGFISFLDKNHPEIPLVTFGDLNKHLIAIRLKKEPDKPTSKLAGKNAFYIQENYDWEKDVVKYFKELKQ